MRCLLANVWSATGRGDIYARGGTTIMPGHPATRRREAFPSHHPDPACGDASSADDPGLASAKFRVRAAESFATTQRYAGVIP
jgi:hypothetical protein